jgi:DNA-binding transcriptional LysR family regulator
MMGLLPRLDVALELQHTEAIKQAVSLGLGLGCLSRLAVEAELRSGQLAAIPVPNRNFRRRFYFVLRRGKYHSAALSRWLSVCREHEPGPRRPGARRQSPRTGI